MKKTKMKVGLIIMSLITMITMNACTKINRDTADEVCKALSEKYNKTFVALKIGDRFNTDKAKLYLHPEGREDLIFTAWIDKESRQVEDTYIRRCVEMQVEDKLVAAAGATAKDCGFSAVLMCDDTSEETDANISLAAFAEKYSVTGIVVYVPVRAGAANEATLKGVVSAMESLHHELGADVSVLLYAIDDGGFESCVSDMKQNPNLTSTWFDTYGVKRTGVFSVKADGITPQLGDVICAFVGD